MVNPGSQHGTENPRDSESDVETFHFACEAKINQIRRTPQQFVIFDQK